MQVNGDLAENQVFADTLKRIHSQGPVAFIREYENDKDTSPFLLFSRLNLTMPIGLRMAEASAQYKWLKTYIMKNLYTRPQISKYASLESTKSLIRDSKRILVVSGAGISTNSGIPDFRSDGGLYDQIQAEYNLPQPECMFDIEFFKIDPKPFYSFAKHVLLRKGDEPFKPTTTHLFIAALEKQGRLLRHYTQNIDTLEEVAGIRNVVYSHGSFKTASCIDCFHSIALLELIRTLSLCDVPYCKECGGIIKPDIVFFGEPLPKDYEKINDDVQVADLLLVIGSSMSVYPVSCIPDLLPPAIPQILVNKEKLNDHNYDLQIIGDCDTIFDKMQ